jgi:hypothetical protein
LLILPLPYFDAHDYSVSPPPAHLLGVQKACPIRTSLWQARYLRCPLAPVAQRALPEGFIVAPVAQINGLSTWDVANSNPDSASGEGDGAMFRQSQQ